MSNSEQTIPCKVVSAKQSCVKPLGDMYALYWHDFYRFAYYCVGRKEDAEDAVQEAYADAIKSIASLQDESAFKPWMLTIISRKCKRILAKRNKTPITPFEDLSHLRDSSASFEDAIDLVSAINQLKSSDRIYLLLHAYCGFTSEEIGSMMHCPAATVRSRNARSIKKLRDHC